jgi:hypothetical protein
VCETGNRNLAPAASASDLCTSLPKLNHSRLATGHLIRLANNQSRRFLIRDSSPCQVTGRFVPLRTCFIRPIHPSPTKPQARSQGGKKVRSRVTNRIHRTRTRERESSGPKEPPPTSLTSSSLASHRRQAYSQQISKHTLLHTGAIVDNTSQDRSTRPGLTIAVPYKDLIRLL